MANCMKEPDKKLQKELKDFDKIVVEESRWRSQKGTLFCPECGSTNVKTQFYGLGEAAISPQMKCENCGFYGFMMKGTKKEIERYRKELAGRRK